MELEVPSAKIALMILRFRPCRALPPSMYRKIRLCSKTCWRWRWYCFVPGASLFCCSSNCFFRSFQSSSRTSHMNCSQRYHRSHRSGCKTEQLNAHPTACQKSSARDQRAEVWLNSKFNGFISSFELSSLGVPSSSARRRLPP